MTARARLAWIILPLGVAALAGCRASDQVVIQGTLQHGGQPYKAEQPGDLIEVTFHHQGQPLKLSADVDAANGRFATRGPTGAGFPFGDYHITVRVLTYQAGQDRLKGKYSDPRTTPFRYSARPDGSRHVTLDLKAGSITTP